MAAVFLLTAISLAILKVPMWLTLATFVGYAVIYTWFLKPATPQNIVIGGLSGAMPPALGWAAVTNSLSAEAWLLVLIIFVWTPPHFWALAVRYRDDYAAANVPMLPVVASLRRTTLEILVYTIVLWAFSLLVGPVAQLGWIYAVGALLRLLPPRFGPWPHLATARRRRRPARRPRPGGRTA